VSYFITWSITTILLLIAHKFFPEFYFAEYTIHSIYWSGVGLLLHGAFFGLRKSPTTESE